MTYKIDEYIGWINELNRTTKVDIKRILLSDCKNWFYDENTGTIHNQNNSFFSIAGFKGTLNGKEIQQPIIIQNEIGYLGIICKEIDGEMKYLMQAKIEPGNINCVQISPTIQATKSNFTQKHGGNKPLYLEYFIHANEYEILADQIQSEQSSRFYGKRNRNMIIKVNQVTEIELNKRFQWMTLKEIKEMMKYKNLVNMDTRTVLSCLPYMNNSISKEIQDITLYRSIYYQNYEKEIVDVYHKINNYKMYEDTDVSIVRLDELTNWDVKDDEIVCKEKYPYKVVFCDIEIEGREVKRWAQPLFQANGIATFGLIITEIEGILKFLVKLQPEIGAFDKVEIGPTIQKEADASFCIDRIERLFEEKLKNKKNIVFDSILSEEGGRFYHEENRNIILKIDQDELKNLPDEYCLVSYAALNHMNLINNCLNIQLRNLLSTLEV